MAPNETDDSPTKPPRSGGDAPSGSGGLLQRGAVIKDTWRIAEFVGEGGAGAVYIAEHRSLGHPVAVKTLFGKFLRDREMRRRFLEEAIIQANLNHPNIAKVNDVVDDGNLCAIIMEYIDGSSLDKALERLKKPMGIGAACRLMLALLDGMNYAHAQGVVHRDIKPANILLASVADGVQPKITDFGIAKVLSDHRRTETGTAMGTVYYASPEQLTDAKSVDHRADIYSLGCTFYELLTGELPFEDSSMYGVMRLHVQGPRPDPREKRPKLTVELANVVVRAMAIDRNNRPQTCAEFAEELRNAMPGSTRASGAILIPRDTSATVARAPASATGLQVAAPATPAALPPTQPLGSTVPGPARTIEPPLRFTKPNTTLPTPPRPRRNPVAIGMWVLIGVTAIALAAFVATQLKAPPATDDTPIVTPPIAPGSGNAAAEPVDAGDDDVSAVDSDEAAPVARLTLAECRELVGRHLDDGALGSARLSRAIESLETAERVCPRLFEEAAQGIAVETIIAYLDVELIRIDLHQLRALQASRTGDACPDALSAATATDRALRRIGDASRDVALHRFEVENITERAGRFVELYQRVRSRHPMCAFAELPDQFRPRPDGSGAKPGG